MVIAAFVLSIISLVSTIGLTVWQIVLNKKINTINIKSSIYTTIFDDYLIYKIPQSRKLIQFDKDQKFIGGEELRKDLVDLLKDALYFRYNSKSFYDELEKSIQSLEDYLVTNMDKSFHSIKQGEILVNIDNMIQNLYKIIETKRISG